MRIEMILSEGEVRQLRDTLDWVAKEAAACADAESLSDVQRAYYKNEMLIAMKVFNLIDLALIDYVNSKKR